MNVAAAVHIKGKELWSAAKLTSQGPMRILETKGHLFVVLNCEEAVTWFHRLKEILAVTTHLPFLFHEPVLNSKDCIK